MNDSKKNKRLLYVAVPLFTLIISAFYMYEVVRAEIRQQLNKSAQLVSREISAAAEQLSLFSEMAPDFLNSAADKEIQLKLNRLIYGTKGVVLSELIVPQREISLKNNFSTEGLFLNTPPQSPCQLDDVSRKTAKISKFGLINFRYCPGNSIELLRKLEHNDKNIGSVLVLVALPELIVKVTKDNQVPTLVLNQSKDMDFECKVEAPWHWCSIEATSPMMFAAFQGNFAMLAKTTAFFFLMSFLLTQIILVPINNAWLALRDIAHGRAIDAERKIAKGFLYKSIEQSIISLSRIAAENIRLREENAIEKGQILASKQIAHDIRSPLAALEMAMSKTCGLPEDSRLIIRNSVSRIKDIANSLLFKQKRNGFRQDVASNVDIVSSESRSVVLLAPMIEALVTEKRLEFRDRLNISIEFNQTTESYGIFSSVKLSEIKCMLSNLINNAVESYLDQAGIVVVSLVASVDNVVLEVGDRGCGIPSDLIASLGLPGTTYNKAGGNGLGIFHAKQTVHQHGGNLQINSTVGIGTSVRVSLPRHKKPSWFVSEIEVMKDQKVIVFDDDRSIHEIWNERFDSLCESEKMVINLFHVSTPGEFRRLYGASFFEDNEALFLMDYEILGTSESGFDLIHEMGIQKQSILVTSHYEDTNLRLYCEREGVRLIPKSMSGFVPIVVKNVRDKSIPSVESRVMV